MPQKTNDKDLLKVELVTYPVDGANYPDTKVCEVGVDITNMSDDAFLEDIKIFLYATNASGDCYEFGRWYGTYSLRAGNTLHLQTSKYRLTENDLKYSDHVTFYAVATYRDFYRSDIELSATSEEVTIYNNTLRDAVLVVNAQLISSSHSWYRNDNLVYEVTITNIGTRTAYDVSIELDETYDKIPDNKYGRFQDVGDIAPGQTVPVKVYEKLDGPFIAPDTLHVVLGCRYFTQSREFRYT